MIKGFYDKLEKPLIILAPMEDVTDNAFRHIINKYGKPDIFYTEFTSADGLCSEGREFVNHRLEYNKDQKPIVAQIFSKDPNKMAEATEYCVELGFDGIDINMGCPAQNICNQGAGSAMIRTPKLAQKVIRACMKAAGNVPVSVKTRLGYTRLDEMEDWVKTILETEPVKLTMHGRTRKEMSKVPAHWDKIAEVVQIRDDMGSESMIIGNGDVKSLDEAYEKVEKYGVDGVMIGRGIFGNPWLFNKEFKKQDLSIFEVLKVLQEHVETYDKYFKERKNFHYMRKHFKAYIKGYPNTKDLKVALLSTDSSEEVYEILDRYIEENQK